MNNRYIIRDESCRAWIGRSYSASDINKAYKNANKLEENGCIYVVYEEESKRNK